MYSVAELDRLPAFHILTSSRSRTEGQGRGGDEPQPPLCRQCILVIRMLYVDYHLLRGPGPFTSILPQSVGPGHQVHGVFMHHPWYNR